MPIQFAPDPGQGFQTPNFYADALLEKAKIYGQTVSAGLAANAQDLRTQADSAAQYATIQERQREAQQARLASPRDYFQAQVESDQINQQQAGQVAETFARGAVQQSLQQQELSQAEKMQMQKLLTAKSYVNTSVQNGTLSPEEGQAYLQQIQTGLNPLQTRAESTKVQLEQQQLQQAVKQGQTAAAFDNADMATKTQLVQQRIVNLPDPLRPGQTNQFILDHKGDLVAVPHQDARPKEQKPVTTLNGPYGPIDPSQEMQVFDKNYAEVVNHVRSRIDKNMLLKGSDKPGEQAAFNPVLTPENDQALIAQELAARGFAPTRQEHLRSMLGQPPLAQQQPTQQPQGGQPPAAPAPPAIPKETVLKAISAHRESVGARTDLPPETKKVYEKDLEELHSLASEYGSFADMPPEAKKKALEIRARLNAVPPSPSQVKPPAKVIPTNVSAPGWYNRGASQADWGAGGF